MTTEWKVICNENNTELVSKDEYSTFSGYDGFGIYIIDIPDKFYHDAKFSVSAHLEAPNVPNGTRCQVKYYNNVCCNKNAITKIGNNNHSIIIGYNKVFMPGMTDKTMGNNMTSINYPFWKACLTIHFLIPFDMNNNKHVYPGKDWNLTLTFTFEDIKKIKEREDDEKQKIKLEQDNKKEEDEFRKLKIKAQIEAEAKVNAELKFRTSKNNKNINDFTYNKLSKYTVAGLKDICNEYNISKNGKKEEIIDRIIKHMTR